VKRFLEGVDGVLVDEPLLIGGVRARDSRAAELRVFNDVGVDWGISLWNNSERSSVEKVRFASSAIQGDQHSLRQFRGRN
jgi:hypothetical protein